MVGPVPQRPGCPPAQHVGVERAVGHGRPQAPVEGGPDVAHPVELVPEPGLAQQLADRRRARAARPRPASASNAASAATMPDFIAVCVPLILGTLRKPAVSPIRAPPGKVELGDRLEPALGQRARAVGDPPPAFEEAAGCRDGSCSAASPRTATDRGSRSRARPRSRPTPGSRRTCRARSRHRCALVIGQPTVWITRPLLCRRGVDLPQLLDAQPVGLRLHALAQA